MYWILLLRNTIVFTFSVAKLAIWVVTISRAVENTRSQKALTGQATVASSLDSPQTN